jgi:GMP synthase-like glutamine amidotransferase
VHIQVIQHVPFEGPGLIGEWARLRGHSLAVSHSITEQYPPTESVDLLVVMGGPMDADDEVASPWLTPEKHFVGQTIAAGRLVLGVCLGAQIIAEVLGGRVKRGREPEIGWYLVTLADADFTEPLFAGWPHEAVVGHWHGDTFDLPASLESVLSSAVTQNQAFVFEGRVVGLQFHLEWDAETLANLIRECPADLTANTPHTMTAEQFLAGASEHMPGCRELLFALLDRMAAASEVPR